MNTHRRNWEELASLDPLWAIASDPTRRGGKWEADEFFTSGRDKVDPLMREINVPRNRCLDFGCGVGRMTKALALHFSEAHGVDISESMLAQARTFVPEATFWQNERPDLQLFPSEHFDLIFSYVVLQHVPQREVIRSYIREFIRLLSPEGVAVFQLPSRIPFRNRLQLRRHAYSVLHSFVSAERMLRWNLSPMKMNSLSQTEVESVVSSAGGHIFKREAIADGVSSILYFCARSTSRLNRY